MNRNVILSVICLFCFSIGQAQKHKFDHLSIAFTTLHTNLPFGSFSNLFSKELHPGFEAGTGFNWKNRTKHDWFQTFQFGYSYHRFVQHSIFLYSEIGYRYKFWKTFSAETKFGAGYLQAISAVKVFKLKNDGTYEKQKGLGRPQAIAGLSLSINKKISASGLALFLEYQQRLQFPFINSYVPLLPSNIMMIGAKIPFRSK